MIVVERSTDVCVDQAEQDATIERLRADSRELRAGSDRYDRRGVLHVWLHVTCSTGTNH